MDYNTFISSIEGYLRDQYPNAEISLSKVTKNNGVILDGISVNENRNNICETIYLNRYYDLYSKGLYSLDEIKEAIADVHRKSFISDPVDFSFFREYSEVKDLIAFKLINLMMNKELLTTVPHLIYLDFAIVFYCMIEDESIGRGTVLIKNSHMEAWNITAEELFEIAVKNSPKLLPSKVIGMDEFLRQLHVKRDIPFEESVPDTSDELCNMYILTNKDKYYGASVLMYENLLSDLSDRFLSSFFIIPSSIHEVILFPTNNRNHLNEFNLMVKEVNSESLDREDILSDHAYFYDRDNRALYAS